MRRFRFIVTSTLSITATFLVVLSPAFYFLHLATFDNRHTSDNTHTCSSAHPVEHARCASCCGHVDDEHHSHEPENSGTGNEGGKEHDSNTCTICKAFDTFINGVWIPPSPPPVVDLIPPLSVPLPERPIPGNIDFSSGYPRAPPAC